MTTKTKNVTIETTVERGLRYFTIYEVRLVYRSEDYKYYTVGKYLDEEDAKVATDNFNEMINNDDSKFSEKFRYASYNSDYVYVDFLKS